MKRKELTYDDWSCIISKKSIIKGIELYGEKTYLALNEMKEVREPQIWRFNGSDVVICDKGIQWLSILQEQENYCITAMINEQGEIILWYIDMIASKGVNEEGVPYFDDLYLDLVVYPDGTIYVDDMDELEEAWRCGDISKELYELALRTSEELQGGLLQSVDEFAVMTKRFYAYFENM